MTIPTLCYTCSVEPWQDYVYLVGIDEVGRGPLAGPVAVGAFVITKRHKDAALRLLRGIRDSKQLREQQREDWFTKLTTARTAGIVDFRVSFVGQERIDRIGIGRAIRTAVSRSLMGLSLHHDSTKILLDGGLSAPSAFPHQKSIRKGDTSEPVIAAASIVAKVLRDRRMTRYARRFPDYGFERHKGYGTTEHIKNIRRHGLSPLHRVTFCSFDDKR